MKAEGIWPATVLGATYGEDDKQQLVVRINARIDDGPSKGQLCTYEDQVNPKSSLYIARSCKAVGWKGRTLTTLPDDCAAWIAESGGKSSVEIKHIEIKNGKRAGQIWDKVNSVGRGPKPLAAPAKTTLTDADDYMRQAMRDDGAPPDDDVPHPGTIDGDIPF